MSSLLRLSALRRSAAGASSASAYAAFRTARHPSQLSPWNQSANNAGSFMALTMSMAGFGSFSARAVVDLRVLPAVASTAGRGSSGFALRRISGLLGALGEVFLQGRPGGFALVGLGADGFQQPLRGRADADQLVIADGLTADDRALQLFGAERQAGRLVDQVALKLADVAAELIPESSRGGAATVDARKHARPVADPAASGGATASVVLCEVRACRHDAPELLKRKCARFQQSRFKTQQDDLIANSRSKSCAKATITENYAALPREVEVEARADAALRSNLRAGKWTVPGP